jgi:hypothetical protein
VKPVTAAGTFRFKRKLLFILCLIPKPRALAFGTLELRQDQRENPKQNSETYGAVGRTPGVIACLGVLTEIPPSGGRDPDHPPRTASATFAPEAIVERDCAKQEIHSHRGEHPREHDLHFG